jgi:hypothetical protein
MEASAVSNYYMNAVRITLAYLLQKGSVQSFQYSVCVKEFAATFRDF